VENLLYFLLQKRKKSLRRHRKTTLAGEGGRHGLPRRRSIGSKESASVQSMFDPRGGAAPLFMKARCSKDRAKKGITTYRLSSADFGHGKQNRPTTGENSGGKGNTKIPSHGREITYCLYERKSHERQRVQPPKSGRKVIRVPSSSEKKRLSAILQKRGHASDGRG